MATNVLIVAELSANHLNQFDVAANTVKAMAKSGADAVKVQTFSADSISLDVDNSFFGPLGSGPWKGTRPYELYKQAAMPWEWQPKLKELAEELGLEFFSSPFDMAAIDFLEDIGVSRYKIASFEVTDIPLITQVAKQQKPIILSTGVASQEDIKLAVDTCRDVGNEAITLLKCTSEYPASIADANLRTMSDMQSRFQVAVGISDHTLGSVVPMAAVALGAVVVEKHFILDRSMGGADSGFSMEPAEFREMVNQIRNVESTLGEISYSVSEKNKLRRRSLFAVRDIEKGEVITAENVRSVRPGHGMHPKKLADVIGRKANRNISKGTPLTAEAVDGQ